MNKQKIIISISKSFIIGVFILIGSIIIANSISNTNKYELIIHENHIIIFNKETGDYYEKFIQTNAALRNWELEENPFESKDK